MKILFFLTLLFSTQMANSANPTFEENVGTFSKINNPTSNTKCDNPTQAQTFPTTPDWKPIYRCLREILPHTGITIGMPLGVSGPVVFGGNEEETVVVTGMSKGVKKDFNFFTGSEDGLSPEKKAIFDALKGTRYGKTAPEDPAQPLTKEQYAWIKEQLPRGSLEQVYSLKIVQQPRMFFIDDESAETLVVPDVNIGDDLLYKAEWKKRQFYINGDALNHISGAYDQNKKPIKVDIKPVFDDYPLSPDAFDQTRFKAMSKKMKGYELSNGEPIVKSHASTQADMPYIVEKLTKELREASMNLYYHLGGHSPEEKKIEAKKWLTLLSSENCSKSGVPQTALSEAREKFNEILK